MPIGIMGDVSVSLSDELVPDAPVPENGELPLPDGYGLGVEVDEKFSVNILSKGLGANLRPIHLSLHSS